jgi:hypothetical protein
MIDLIEAVIFDRQIVVSHPRKMAQAEHRVAPACTLRSAG